MADIITMHVGVVTDLETILCSRPIVLSPLVPLFRCFIHTNIDHSRRCAKTLPQFVIYFKTTTHFTSQSAKLPYLFRETI